MLMRTDTLSEGIADARKAVESAERLHAQGKLTKSEQAAYDEAMQRGRATHGQGMNANSGIKTVY